MNDLAGTIFVDGNPIGTATDIEIVDIDHGTELRIGYPSTTYELSASLFLSAEQASFHRFPPAPPPPWPVNEHVQLLPFRLEILRATDEGNMVHVITRVQSTDPHVVFDETGTLDFRLPISPTLAGEKRTKKIRRLLAFILMHELNECLRYADGTPVVEPHPERHGTYGEFGGHPEIDHMTSEARK